MRLVPRSLHGRMLALSIAATVIALLIAGLGIARILEGFVVQGLDQRLDGELALLASTVDGDGNIDRAKLDARIAALDPGPGWRWRIDGPNGTVGSSDFPRLEGSGPLMRGPLPLRAPAPGEAIMALDGGDDHGSAVHARRLIVATRKGPVTITTAAPRAVVRTPILGALEPLLASLAGLAVLLTAAMLLQLRIGLRPLRRLRVEVAAIRNGEHDGVQETYPLELRPLASELNALAADNASALATARGSAANLAHALKTPVATLALTLRDLPEAAAQLARVDATIGHHLARARAEVVNRRASTMLAQCIGGVVEAVARIHADRSIACRIEIVDDLSVAIDEQDCDELFGVLIDNAFRHAETRVLVTAIRSGRTIEIILDDDGPGIPAAQRDRVLEPGKRLDERDAGHGFGLAIANDLATLYGGAIRLGDSPLDGLRVAVSLPFARS